MNRTDPLLVALRREQDHARLRLGHTQLDPALFLIERLIGDDGEAEFLRVEIQRPVLIGHRDTDELDLFDHD